MKLLAPLAALALAGVTLTAAPLASHAADADALVITPEIVTANGTGCPATESKIISKVDGNTWSFTFPYQSMISGAGATVTPRDFRKNCQLNLRTDVPKGYTYAVKKSTLSGSAYVENGARAAVELSQYFQGSSVTTKQLDSLVGLRQGGFSFTSDVSDANLMWAPCDVSRNLNLNVVSRVEKGTQTEDSYSWVRMDEADGLKVEIVTKKC